MEDLTAWYGKFAEWADSKGNTFDKMSVAILTPYFSSDLSTHDVMWVTNTPWSFRAIYWSAGMGDRWIA